MLYLPHLNILPNAPPFRTINTNPSPNKSNASSYNPSLPLLTSSTPSQNPLSPPCPLGCREVLQSRHTQHLASLIITHPTTRHRCTIPRHIGARNGVLHAENGDVGEGVAVRVGAAWGGVEGGGGGGELFSESEMDRLQTNDRRKELSISRT